MNLRNWSKQHTIGLLIAIATTLVFIPIVMFILSKMNGNKSFITMWVDFWSPFSRNEKTKIISLSSIANLFWFHKFMRKDKYNFGMGVIIATVINLLIILYFKFLA